MHIRIYFFRHVCDLPRETVEITHLEIFKAPSWMRARRPLPYWTTSEAGIRIFEIKLLLPIQIICDSVVPHSAF